LATYQTKIAAPVAAKRPMQIQNRGRATAMFDVLTSRAGMLPRLVWSWASMP